jgi:outer membrane lipoprotein-sorting protein
MDRGRWLWVGIVGLLWGGTTVVAGQLPRPVVDYSADVVMAMSHGSGGEPMTIAGKLYASGKKERRETTMMGRTSVIITRRDKKVSWILIPERKMYMEHQATAQEEDPYAAWEAAGVTLTKLGQETVNGVQATKYRADAAAKDGHTDTGLLWMTKENIPVRMEAQVPEEGGQVTIDYTHIKIGTQDAALFEVPPGYQKMVMPQLGAMPGAPGRGALPGHGSAPADRPTEEQMRQIREQMQRQMQEMMKQPPGK